MKAKINIFGIKNNIWCRVCGLLRIIHHCFTANPLTLTHGPLGGPPIGNHWYKSSPPSALRSFSFIQWAGKRRKIHHQWFGQTAGVGKKLKTKRRNSSPSPSSWPLVDINNYTMSRLFYRSRSGVRARKPVTSDYTGQAPGLNRKINVRINYLRKLVDENIRF